MKYKIFREDGSKCEHEYELVGSTSIKNVVKIRNCLTGKIRLIHKDRVYQKGEQVKKKKVVSKAGVKAEEKENKKENKEVVKETKTKTNTNAKAKPTKKKLEKFDFSSLDGEMLFKMEGSSKLVTNDKEMKVERYAMVDKDGTKMRFFQLYDGSVGRKGTTPQYTDKDKVKEEFYGNIEAISEYLNKKKYKKV